MLYESMTERQRELSDKAMDAEGLLYGNAEFNIAKYMYASILGDRQIGDDGAEAIAEALKVNTTMSELDLGKNQIGVAGAQSIAEALKVNTTLTTLYLDRNQIGDAGAEAIAEALKVNTTVNVLDLRLCHIGYAGVLALAEALKVNTTVTMLYLGKNAIGDAGAQAIAETLKVNTTLTWLNLPQNCIGNSGTRAIVEALKDSCRREVYISDQIRPLVFSLTPRLASAEDVQTVFHLLTSGLALEDQSASLPVLPVELAEHIMDEAQYWQGVQCTKRERFQADTPDVALKVTVPRSLDGNWVCVKSIHVLRDKATHDGDSDDSAFELIVRDEQGSVRCEFAAQPTFLDATLESLTIWPALAPIIRQMRGGWEVQVRPSKSVQDVGFESLYLGYVGPIFAMFECPAFSNARKASG
ncbi:hypothetical protein CAOG_003935 [Capsaspora owczarzaki ATCC 30864]|uniref:NOD3 protein n=2 Tax=Capsaspora owczarzaki (strain ATCC 30864) TaxID=595528 RepID=A0A0D2X2T0_CAPO3|nr:hypothetical protein CAOG_003935 [Capsaspora owczarzaki ATCC 30864]